MPIGRRLSCWCLVLICVIVSGCGLPRSTWVRPHAVVARNQDGESVTVNLRFVQLSHWKAFRSASFDELWADPATALGDELLGAPYDVTIQPVAEGDEWSSGQRLALPTWEGGARYLGVILLTPQQPTEGSRRAIIAARDAFDYVIDIAEGAIALGDR